MAANFEAEPTEVQQKQMKTFFNSIGDFYPCDECASHFRGMLEKTPPDVSSNQALSTWLCERHNEVNARLHKSAFKCDATSLKERWGDCGCSEKVPQSSTPPQK
jgi:FAD-linked sulfhydryl oxidase